MLAGLLALAVFALGSAALNALLVLYALGSGYGGPWFPLAVVTYVLAILLTAWGFGWAARRGTPHRTSAVIWATGACLIALYLLAVGFEVRFAIDWLFPPLGREPRISLWRIVGVSFAALLFLVTAEATTFDETDEYRTPRRHRRDSDSSDKWLDRLQDTEEAAGPDIL